MTSVLLDTHAVVWAVTDPDRLGDDARALVTDPTVELLVSAASAWEIATKARLGRWPAAVALARQYLPALARLGVTHVDITAEDALGAGRMTWDHRDPFDRIIATQALSRGVPVATVDGALVDLPGLDVRW